MCIKMLDGRMGGDRIRCRNSDYGMAGTAWPGVGLGRDVVWAATACDGPTIQWSFKMRWSGGTNYQISVVAAAVVVALGTELVAGGGVHEGIVEELIFLFVAFIAFFLLATLAFGLILLDFLWFL